MKTPLSPSELKINPALVALPILLPSGSTALFRPLAAADGLILGKYFGGLSPETRFRFGPHAFDQATADYLCASIDLADTIRMIAVSDSNGEEMVLAYFILVLGVSDAERDRYAAVNILLDAQSDCTFAPSVADAFQNQGVGKPLIQHVVEIARALGRERMVLMGGTQATNSRAIHYYQKAGFRTIATFDDPPGFLNYDMVLDL
jgi:GNAT superfamily N-acetyltransferase